MSPSLRPRAALERALLAAAALFVLAAPRAQAVAGSPYSGTGFDVSYPQCSSYRGVTGAYGIVGVNGGRPFTDNSCFDAEYDAARDAAQPVSIYMNLKAPVGRTGPVYTSGPRSCGSDKLCQAHNYGWNAADHAYKAALPRTAATWWLDIETANSWTGKTAINVATIQGAVDYFTRQPTLGVQAVGIYSTPAMWRTITGGHRDPTWPVWVPGADKGSCGTGFTTGPVWLVQTASGVSNGDLAC